MADQEDKPKITPEMMKNNQELAAQAAFRAQQIMLRKSPAKKSIPPVVPARGDSVLSKQPPEIPPKRHSLKKIDDHGNASTPSKAPMAPPPLPQKPSMVRNMANKLTANSDVPPMKNTPAAVVAPPINVPPKQINSPQIGHKMTTNGSQIGHKMLSPVEDFSSVDALRGIESGLRNMERAMQEQMNIRSAAAAVQHQHQHQHQQQQQQQNVKPSDKMNFNPIRSMERGFSMDQMRLDAMNLGSMRSTLEEMKSKGFVNMNTMAAPNLPNPRPIDNHMKSLDRNLPLELQYSRHHHHRSQSQQEMVEQMRHNLANSATGATTMLSNARQSGAAISREDVRLRRRSSHDENQMSQSQANAAGKIQNLKSISIIVVVFFRFIGFRICLENCRAVMMKLMICFLHFFFSFQLIVYVNIGTKLHRVFYNENHN